jgi:hypothetical protein
MKKSTDGNTSWWEKLINFPSIMEALVSGVFMILGWFASAIEWWAYILQTAILFIGYSLSPIFIGMLAFPSLQQTGRNYLLNLVGVMIWPLGWGVAGLITQGMIDFMTDQSFLSSSSAPNTLYSLQNLMGLAFLGIWIIFSTIAAPVAIQKAIATGIPPFQVCSAELPLRAGRRQRLARPLLPAAAQPESKRHCCRCRHEKHW